MFQRVEASSLSLTFHFNNHYTDTTNTPYIKILQGHDRHDAILGPPGSPGPPGRDSTNGRDGVKGKKENKDQEMRVWFL